MSKYPRTFHLPKSPGATSDDKISKSVSSIFGIEIIITEKIDGENTDMTDSGIYARSHSAYTTSPWSREVRNLDGVYLFGA